MGVFSILGHGQSKIQYKEGYRKGGLSKTAPIVTYSNNNVLKRKSGNITNLEVHNALNTRKKSSLKIKVIYF